MDIRVHGNKKIRRSENIQSSNNYLIYKEQLVKDFRDLCGYCGKNRNYFFDNFQIDHFRPKSKYPDLKNDYNNLVLSCPICNRNKSDDWPTNDKYKIIIEDYCGWIVPICDVPDEDNFTCNCPEMTTKEYCEKHIYLSTHTFYGKHYKHSTELLQKYGFDIEIDNWDKEIIGDDK